ncbi:GNAT family N-acetyltransferase [Nocardioides sp.]|uniref:GNAT family N-acetyltransferase n=1 Tax=Nocardioides sp. TaxID=35761 RepID=UPI002ED7A3D9
MSRKIVRLTLDHLDAIESPCRTCLFWELDPVRRERVADPAAAKDAWVSEVLREWGSCGRVALVDDVPVGFVVYAPEAFLPGAAAFPTAPVSPDAVLLTMAYVDPALRGGGLGRMLVQGMARDLIQRGGVGAVEAFGDTAGRSGRHLLPVDFLGSVGFKTHRAHATTPRMRMDLRMALSWKDEFEAALERLVGVMRPVPKPARPPAPKATRG